MKRSLRIGLVLALLLSLAVWNIASAHAKLVSSDPAAGAKLDKPPAKLTLVFSEEISANETESFFKVTDASGAQVGSGKLDTTDLDHKTLTGALNSGVSDGVYTVAWQTITTDDNGKSEGSFSFGINMDPGTQPTPTPHQDAEPTAAPTPRPTTAPAAGGAAQPTATPAAGAAAPSTLPKTGESGPSLNIAAIIGACVLLLAGLLILRARKRA